MPIYAYKCSSCGVSKDILRKISDAPLTTCPACGKESLDKQVTAAGFQLKGSGWYVTDFREGQKPVAGVAQQASLDKASADKTSADKASTSDDSKPAKSVDTTPSATTTTAAATASPPASTSTTGVTT